MQIDILQIVIFAGLAIILTFWRFVVSGRGQNKFLKIPMGLLITYLIIKAIIPIFGYFDLHNVSSPLSVAATLLLWMAIVRIIIFIVVDYFIRQRRGVVIPSITRDFVLAILYIIITMVVLKQKTDVNLGSLLTTSAILTAVIGFAMQDTLGNLFSGLALQLEHPYQIGDWIGFEGTVGKVSGITWKSTKIVTRSEEMIFVPNNVISKSVLANYSRPTERHWASVEVGTSYDDPPHKVRTAIIDVMRGHQKVLSDPAPDVRVVKYDNFSINYKVVFATEDFANEERTKTEILNALWYKFQRSGIKIPYPIQEEWQITPSEIKKRTEHLVDEADVAEILSKIDIFASLLPEIRSDLAKRVSVLPFAAAEIIVRQDDPAGPMYIIKEGDCSVVLASKDGESAEVARLGPMNFFGEMSVLTGAPRTATVRAVTAAICYEIEKIDLQEIFVKNPSVLTGISETLAARQANLAEYKDKLGQEGGQTDHKNQFMSKIKAFFGL